MDSKKKNQTALNWCRRVLKRVGMQGPSCYGSVWAISTLSKSNHPSAAVLKRLLYKQKHSAKLPPNFCRQIPSCVPYPKPECSTLNCFQYIWHPLVKGLVLAYPHSSRLSTASTFRRFNPCLCVLLNQRARAVTIPDRVLTTLHMRSGLQDWSEPASESKIKHTWNLWPALHMVSIRFIWCLLFSWRTNSAHSYDTNKLAQRNDFLSFKVISKATPCKTMEMRARATCPCRCCFL